MRISSRAAARWFATRSRIENKGREEWISPTLYAVTTARVIIYLYVRETSVPLGFPHNSRDFRALTRGP